MSLTKPTQIAVPFAASGSKTSIPASANNVTGRAGYDAGFPAITRTAKAAGGIPPFGTDFNGIFYDAFSAIQYLEAGGAFPYDSTFAAAIGGYPVGALVSRADGMGLWKNLVAGNTTNPDNLGAGWDTLNSGITSISMTSSNVTLTAGQAANDIIVISGALTTNLNLIFPIFKKSWEIINNCTGAFSVTCKTASGTGIAVYSTGVSKCIYCDGTNISSIANITVKRQVFTSSSTYTPSAGMVYCDVEIVGGGGGGGGATGGSGTSSAGGGGGGGGYAKKIFTAAQIGASQTVTIGAGGVGASGNSTGGTGGTTTFGALLTANGGAGGGGSIASTTAGMPAAGGQGGTASGGDINVKGGNGFATFVLGGSSGGLSGQGGSTIYGAGGYPSGPAGSGYAGSGYGSGASGGASNTASVATGASGASGLVIVTEYCTQ